MSNDIYIHDDFGNRIPLLDNYGNLSFEVIMLYSEDKLTATDRKAVDSFAATDEMSRDALDGYALTSNSSKTRHQLGQVNAGIQEISGAKAVSSLAPPKNEFDYRRLAAAVALLVIVAGGTYFGSQFFGDDELANNTVEEKEIEPKREVVRQFSPVAPISDSANTPSTEPSELEEGTISATEVAALDEVKSEMKNLEVVEEAEIADAEFDIAEDDLADNRQEPTPAEELFNQQTGAATGNTAAMAKEIEQILSEDVAADKDLMELTRQEGNELEQAERERLQEELKRYERLAAASELEESAKQKAEKRAEVVAEMAMEEMEQASMDEIVVGENQRSVSARKAKESAYQSQQETAKFPGGDLEMYKFIENTKRYTDAMIENDLKGAVVVSFQIDKNGKVSKAKVNSGQVGMLAQDALRVIESMPNWEPAKKENGNPVKSERVVTIRYGE